MRAMKRLGALVGLVFIISSCNRGSSVAPGAGPPNPFTVTARFTAASLGAEHFLDLAIGPDGNLYVTDAGDTVSVISPAGEVLRSWGGRGSGPGEFRFVAHDPSDPYDVHAKIAVGPDGRVFVTDNGNHRIQTFTAQGVPNGEIGSFGNAPDQFLEPRDAVVDGAGNLYVADGQLDGVLEFSPDGGFIRRIGGTGAGDPDLAGQLHSPNIDPLGRMVITNEAGRVLYVDEHGHVVDAFDGGGCDATVDGYGYTYVNADADGCEGGFTKVFDREHQLVGQWIGDDNPLGLPPRFGPNGEAFALGTDGSILALAISLPES